MPCTYYSIRRSCIYTLLQYVANLTTIRNFIYDNGVFTTMESKPVRISEFSINEIRDIAKEIGEPTDDTAIRHILAEYKRLKVENELLLKKLRECEKRNKK